MATKKPTKPAKPASAKQSPLATGEPAIVPPREAALDVATSALPTQAELTAWYEQLLASRTFRSRSQAQAFFYAACWSNDAELERVFENWQSETSNARGDRYLPMDLYEERLVHDARWDDLHGFWRALDPAQLARARRMVRTFLAHPARAPERFEPITE
jgi:hypothetical protein